MKTFNQYIIEKLKITKNSSPIVDESTVEVPYYEFVRWYIGMPNREPDEITEEDLRASDFADSIIDIKGVEVFKNARLAYDFYEDHKDDIATIITKERRATNLVFNTIKLDNIVFYAYSDANFKEYILYSILSRNRRKIV